MALVWLVEVISGLRQKSFKHVPCRLTGGSLYPCGLQLHFGEYKIASTGQIGQTGLDCHEAG